MRRRAEETMRPGVEDRPTQRLRASALPVPLEAQQLEPPDEVGGEHHGRHPVGVRLKVAEGEAAEPGVLQPLDVVLDVGMCPHDDVEADRVTGLVGVEAPVTELKRGQEASLSTGVEAVRAAR